MKKSDSDVFFRLISALMGDPNVYGKGMNYNKIWAGALSGKKDPMFILGFGFGLMNEMGFDDYLIIGF